MQLLFIRHALPRRSRAGEGSDPDLSDVGLEQARRLPEALRRYSIDRVVSSPLRRARQTAAPVADAFGVDIEVDERFAGYDRDLTFYVPVEQMRTELPAEWDRLAAGLLPSGVDEDVFLARVGTAVDDVIATADPEHTVAVFSHGGVINVVLYRFLLTSRLVSFPIEYASVTGLRVRRTGRIIVANVNVVEHVWDLLRPRSLNLAGEQQTHGD